MASLVFAPDFWEHLREPKIEAGKCAD